MTKTVSSQELSNLDIWSSILEQNNKDEASQSNTTPYIHPLVKKTKSYLSEKSLEICTESLGSETGSDGFSSSEDNNNSEDDEKLKETANMVKKPRCFPPPLSSLTTQTQQLHMRPHRDNGRLFLFLQVASVPSRNSFAATRQNGRLILTFANHDDEEIHDENETVTEQPCSLSLELAVNKAIGLVNKKPKWSEKLNKVTNFEDVKAVQHGSNSLPLINGYQYCEHQNSNRNKVVVYGNMNIYQGSNEATQNSHQLFVHNRKLCKDSRTTMLPEYFIFSPLCSTQFSYYIVVVK